MSTPTPTAPAPPSQPAAAVEQGALVRAHERNLHAIAKIPICLEYITPQEILLLIRYCFDYRVDFTQGLEPTGNRDEAVYVYRLPAAVPPVASTPAVNAPATGGFDFEDKPCRVRHEPLLTDPDGVWVPDGNIAWAQRILGMLSCAVRQQLEAALARKQ